MSLDWLLSGTIVVLGSGTMVPSAYTLTLVAVYAVSGSMFASTKKSSYIFIFCPINCNDEIPVSNFDISLEK